MFEKSTARKDDAIYYSLNTGVSIQDRPKSFLGIHTQDTIKSTLNSKITQCN